jgi:hypothetical protein
MWPRTVHHLWTTSPVSIGANANSAPLVTGSAVRSAYDLCDRGAVWAVKNSARQRCDQTL